MVGECVMFFKITHPVNLLMHKIKLCSFTSLISQKFSDSAVILANSKCPSVASCEYARLEYWIFVYRPFSHCRKNFLRDYFFTVLFDFGLPFSINFLSSSAFLGFRKALEHDTMCSSVSVVRTLENVQTRVKRNIFSYTNFQRSQKRHCYQLHWDTLFQKCLWSRSINWQHVFYRV